MLVGLACGLIGAPLVASAVLAGSFLLFVASMTVLGMGVGAAQQLRVAVTDMYPGNRRAEGLGYLLLGSMIGALTGPIIVGLSETATPRLEVNNLALPWLILPLFIVSSMLIAYFARPDPKQMGADLGKYWPGYVAPKRPPPVARNVVAYFRSYPRVTGFVSYAFAQGTMAMMMAQTPHVLSRHGHSVTLVSWAVAIHVVGMYGLSIPLGRLCDRIGRTTLILAGLVIFGAGAVLAVLTDLYWLITGGIFVVGIGWSAVFIASTALIADTTPLQERGRAIGINDSLGAIVAVSLPFVSGAVIGVAGLTTLGVFGAILASLSLFLLPRLRERRPGVFDAAPTSAG